MIKVSKITLKRIPDYDDNHDYLGQFANEPGKFAIKHEGDRHSYPYFNAENVEDMKQARQNYDRMMQFERGEVMSYGVRAVAEVQTSEDGRSWLRNEIESGGLWGIESDSGEEYFKQVEDEQLDELKATLKEFGLIDETIAKAEIIRKGFDY